MTTTGFAQKSRPAQKPLLLHKNPDMNLGGFS